MVHCGGCSKFQVPVERREFPYLIEFDLITAENYNRCSAPKPKRECCGSLSAAYDARTLHLIIVSGQMFKINTARVFDDIYLSTKALGNRNLI